MQENLTFDEMRKVARVKRQTLRLQQLKQNLLGQLESKMNAGDNELINGVIVLEIPQQPAITPDELEVVMAQLREELKCDVTEKRIPGRSQVQLIARNQTQDQ